jgi:LuxR family maltose regulon positive regulatory protein
MLPRHSLYDVLDGATERRLTVVSAGPGWGKTSTVSDWARSRRGGSAIAWLSVDPEDDSLPGFWAAVLHAVRQSGSIPATHPLAVLSPLATVSAQMLQAISRGLLALPDPLILVLDDFHVLEDATVLDSVERLLQYDLPLHVVLLTRSDPC